MIDLSDTIAPKTDQLNADDLIAGAMTIKIRDVKKIESEQQPVSIYFDGDDNKPYKPSKGMRRVLVQLWGADGSLYIGRQLTLFRDNNVTFGGSEVGGIRISHASHIDKPTKVLVTISKSKRRPLTIDPITTKKALTNVQAAKDAITAGTITLEQLQKDREITAEQLIFLQS